jgi:conjugal transfer pilus assembly protein TraU
MLKKLLISKNRFLVLVVLSVFFVFKSSLLYAECKATVFNIIDDVDWTGVFPVKIGGVTIKSGAPEEMQNLDEMDETKKIICICKSKDKGVVIGLATSFWEPARVAEIVKDPWCFPLLGGLKIESQLVNQGGNNQEIAHSTTHQYFAQAHWYMFSVWSMLDLFMDVPCLPWEGFDIAHMTELDPLWQRDDLVMLIHPEVLLFANPIAQASCIADSVASQFGKPIDQLFWCMGSWGSSYPMSGATDQSTIVEGSANLSGRMIYKLSREGIIWDPGVDLCGAVLTPIWVKSNYKMHLMKPVKSRIVPVGQSGLIWGMGKDPFWGTKKGAAENFDWLIFRRVKCCLGISPFNLFR